MPDEYSGQGVLETDVGSPQHEAVPAAESTDAGSDAEQTQGIAQGTPEEWRQAYENRQSWERSLKQKDQRYANVRKVLETAFGRGIDQWNAMDMSDLQAFALINSRIRSDPEFAQRWHGALTQTFQESGATKEQAQAKASEIVQAAGGRPDVSQQQQSRFDVPKEYVDKLNRLEMIAVQQEMQRLEGTLWDELDSQVRAMAPDLAPDYGELLEEQALHGLFFHSDEELIQRAQEGTLPELVGQYVKQAADRLRGTTQKALQRKAESTGRKPAAPTPFGAAAAPAAGPRPDQISLKQMHERFKRAVESAAE